MEGLFRCVRKTACRQRSLSTKGKHYCMVFVVMVEANIEEEALVEVTNIEALSATWWKRGSGALDLYFTGSGKDPKVRQ